MQRFGKQALWTTLGLALVLVALAPSVEAGRARRARRANSWAAYLHPQRPRVLSSRDALPKPTIPIRPQTAQAGADQAQGFSAMGIGDVQLSRPQNWVTDFGCDPTGQVECAAKFNKAGKSISDAGGGVLEIPEGTYLVNAEPIVLYENVIYRGAGRFNTILQKTSGDAPVMRAVNYATGRTLGVVIQDLKVIGHTGMSATTSVVDLTGCSYGGMERCVVWGRPTAGTGTTYGIKFPLGSASFNGYLDFTDTFALYCTDGLRGQCNQVRIVGGSYNNNSAYNIRLESSYGMFIADTEASFGGTGGIKLDGQNADVSGVWYEGNPNTQTGIYSPNNLDTSTCDVVNHRTWNDAGIAGVNVDRYVLGATLKDGHEFFDAVTGSGSVSVNPITFNGGFSSYDASTGIPAGWSTSGDATYSHLSSSLPAGQSSITHGTRVTWTANFPYLRQRINVTPGETISVAGWVKTGSGMTNVRFGIADISDLSEGKYHTCTEGPDNTWIRYVARWTIPEGVSAVYVGLIYCVGTSSGFDSCDLAGVSAFRGKHAFSDGDRFLTSAGGNIYGQDFNIGDRMHGYGTSAPLSGTFDAGEIVYNTAPGNGDPMAWVCTTSGSPGTWTPVAHAYPTATQTWNPANIVTGTSTTQTINCTGAVVGDPVAVGLASDLLGCSLTGYVNTNGQCTVVLTNNTGSDQNVASGTLKVIVLKR